MRGPLTQRKSSDLLHPLSQLIHNHPRLDRVPKPLDTLLKHCKRAVRNFVTPKLRQQLLLRRQVQILVRHDLVPDPTRVDVQPIRGDALRVLGLENIVWVLGVHEPVAQLLNVGLELLWQQQLVREGCEHKVKVVGDLTVLESLGFGETVPYTIQICAECVGQVGEWGRSNVVSDDEEQ